MPANNEREEQLQEQLNQKEIDRQKEIQEAVKDVRDAILEQRHLLACICAKYGGHIDLYDRDLKIFNRDLEGSQWTLVFSFDGYNRRTRIAVAEVHPNE